MNHATDETCERCEGSGVRYTTSGLWCLSYPCPCCRHDEYERFVNPKADTLMGLPVVRVGAP